ncbi:MAG TPA: alanine--tRNA ligase [Candidatus Acidoferrum sp.]|nr:alanine--tRNA ligase [Candidatus Acidoferrum sp.]
MTGNAKKWTGNEIRETFLKFFEGKGHRRVRSSSLVPHGDPTLLFTNAGMNQFKDVFLGLEKRDYSRATTAQKCVRAGGKHNDLENVGFTKRHHTFFEMMGNFSFGDYFKKEAIAFAWELITSPDWYAIPKEKLYVTVFGGAEFGSTGTSVYPGGAGASAAHTSVSTTKLGVDEEAKSLWLAQNVPANRVFEIPGLKDNFWAMGDTGPCGPCSEIFYDMGPAASEQGHADCQFPCDCGRYVEIWNLVFMQFNRVEEETVIPTTGPLGFKHRSVRLEVLPKPCVDTGMGLERVAAVLQGVISNYDTDLFGPLLKRAAELLKVDPTIDPNVEPSLRIIADHSRASTFLISDGVLPSNEGRGYVLRKIMRRAIRHGHMWGAREPFFFKMVDAVRDEMRPPYPELIDSAPRVSAVVEAEERQFGRVIEIGSEKLDELLNSAKAEAKKACADSFEASHPGKIDRKFLDRDIDDILPATLLDPRRTSGKTMRVDEPTLAVINHLKQNYRPVLSGAKAFSLYETYGLPRDFIQDAAKDYGVAFDNEGFDRAFEVERTRARASWKSGGKESANPAYAKIAETFKTEKDFYRDSASKDARIEAIIAKGGVVNELQAGETGEVVLDRTVIYAESGGQVSDTGSFYDNSGSQLLAEVTGAFYPVAGLIAHKVLAKETLRVGDRVSVIADADRRNRVMRNHTGTHLVHAALRNILGTHVKQAGSLNAPDRLRFDFSHFAHVDAEELRDIEQQVNDEIRHNTQVETDITNIDHALASGALAFFGDKYPDANVRVVTIPDERAPRGFYSKELCGGTHVHKIGDIGVLKIVSEESVAAGVRRIEAVTGIGALEHFQKQAEILSKLQQQLNVGEDAVLAQVEKLAQTVKHLEKEISDQKRKGALSQLDDLANSAETVKGVKTVVSQVENIDREALRQLVDSLRQKLGSGVVVLGAVLDGKAALIAGVTKDLTAKVHAGKLIQALAAKVGGKGGGRPDLAEGGGEDTSALNMALRSVPSLLEALL